MKILQGEIGKDLLLNDIQDNQNFAINSYGGSLFEGLAMYDYIKGTDIEVGVIGISASAATLPLLASSKRWGTPNSRYLIHNPWNFGAGEAKDFEKMATELNSEQSRVVSIYSEHLKLDKEAIQLLMNEEKIIDAKEALEIGLITEIREFNKAKEINGNDVKQLFTNFKMFYKMNENEEKELTGLKLAIDNLAKMFKKSIKTKMVVVQDVNGIEIDFADVDTADNIAIGDSATVAGEPANGEYVLNDGTTYVFEGGNLVDVREPMPDESETMKAENEALKAEILELKNELKSTVEMKAELDSISAKFEAFKNQFTTEKAEDSKPETEKAEKIKRVTFKIKK